MALATCQNFAEPLLLNLGYHNLSSGGSAAPAWGIEVEIGTPPQRFSLRPSIYDVTILSYETHCSSQNDYGCLAAQGGVFDPELSSTESVSVGTAWNGTLGGEANAADLSYYFFYNDVLRFGYNETVVWGFPFVTDDGQEWASYSTLGLGSNSSFLQAAVESEAAPSKSWGLWVGSRAIGNEQDGDLVIGGYNDARKATEFSTFDNIPECVTCVQIQNMVWVSDAGVIPLMDNNITDFQVSLNPMLGFIEFPQIPWDLFGAATNGFYDENLGTYTYATSPVGSLNFTIKDGYSTSIPASELFQFQYDYDDYGNRVIADDPEIVALAKNYSNENSDEGNYVFSWGIPFLTMNYLVLDVEEQQFRLSEAIRQDFGDEGGVMPRKLCSGAPPIDLGSSGGTNIGAIVGGVVGGVVFLLILALAIFFCYRRRNRKNRNKEATAQNSAAKGQHYQPVPPTGPHFYPPSSPVMYQRPPVGNYPAQAPMGYTCQPAAGYAPMTQYEGPKPHQGLHPMYTSPASPPAPSTSVVYSDTASTAVQELPSTDSNAGEWRGSQFSSDTNATKGFSEILTTEAPHR
ncbi:uncharacterized protein Z519_06094 [Cladophialophora bantiana CBS 173.52]|uniref:Epidermal growth factor receptor-like transmembrane-juxtamembrane segment domain-containing protein n=1 Tax=Cladophialophora bantiana (strain ATCC 10958 / CBS 173.52 / CDC B-1940 / NIH 8579) TaxID=1442370 RepID=A0A0D2I9Q0_CLAB1|nr:uncharacterized protein Z519_06094 [Cladophialophora bantiana CBS 173.52]KIW93489.1 hypothetical protein Z519_06094 [Cladophialophora bantiana CBS 173.52]